MTARTITGRISTLRPAMLYSFKAFAAAMIALWLGLWLGLKIPYWAMSTAYIVGQPMSGATRSKGIYRAVGTVLGTAMAVTMVPMLVETPAALSLAMALWVSGCLTISLLDRTPRSYALMLAGYTAAIIVFPSVDMPETIWDTAVARVTEILLGITSATLAHTLIFPRSVSDAMRPRIESWLTNAERWLIDAMAGGASAARDRHRLAVDAVECGILATHLPYDTSHWRDSNRVVQALLERMLLLIPALSGLTDRRQALEQVARQRPVPDLSPSDLSPSDLSPIVAETSAWLAAGSSPATQATLAAHLTDHITRHIRPNWADLVMESYLTRLAQALTILSECRQLLAHLDHHTPLPPALRAASMRAGAPRFHFDLPFALLSGLSATVAILTICGLWITTGWADGAGAAVMTAVLCCLFASLDNPVSSILRFGLALTASVPVAGVYLFYILPHMDGYIELTLALAPFLLGVGMMLPHPRWGQTTLAFLMGFSTALAISENLSPDLDHFLNANIGLIVATTIAAGVTALMRSLGTDVVIDRLLQALHHDLIRLSSTATSLDQGPVVARLIDRLALLIQRLVPGDVMVDDKRSHAERALRGVRLAMNVVIIRNLMAEMPARPRAALHGVLRKASRYFATASHHTPPDRPDPGLLHRIDRSLRLLIIHAGNTHAGQNPPTRQDGHQNNGITITMEGIAALVALRRNLFPDADGFDTESPA